MTTAALLDTDLAALDAAFDAIERDARALIAGVSESQGRWQPAPGVWSVAARSGTAGPARRLVSALARAARQAAPPRQGSAGDPAAGRTGAGGCGGAVLRVAPGGARLPAALRRDRPDRRDLPQPVHPRRPVQPGDGPARPRGARTAPPVASVARPPGGGTARRRVDGRPGLTSAIAGTGRGPSASPPPGRGTSSAARVLAASSRARW